MTEWLGISLGSLSGRYTYSQLHAALLEAQGSSDERCSLKQLPTMYCRDPSEAAFAPLE